MTTPEPMTLKIKVEQSIACTQMKIPKKAIKHFAEVYLDLINGHIFSLSGEQLNTIEYECCEFLTKAAPHLDGVKLEGLAFDLFNYTCGATTKWPARLEMIAKKTVTQII